LHALVIDAMPAKVRLLHHVFGIRPRPQHAIRDAVQPGAVPAELGGVIVDGG
jgi:hypothetical protein